MEKWRKLIRKNNSPSELGENFQEAEKILKRFKAKHPELIALKPEIEVFKIIEDKDGNQCDIWTISVYRPFLFDGRLVPEIFECIKVNDIIMGQFPKEFPSENAGLPLEDWFAPERYQKFAENNISLIRQTLLKPDMTVNEALDALTGGFEKHLAWAKKMREERIEENKEQIAFFNELLKKTEIVFRKSDVYNKYKEENWGYSVTATYLKKKSPVIVGFNWGAGNNWKKDNTIEAIQNDYPFSPFNGLYDELGSFKKVVTLFHEYLPQATYGVQTNFCFFRSQYEHQISQHDKELCAPLFEELINYLEPSKLITFSNSLNGYFNQKGKIKAKQVLNIQSKNKTFNVTKGRILIKDKEIDYFNLPHPNYPITTEARLKAWDFCFERMY